MEKIIVIEGEEKYQFKDIEELVKCFINKNYYDMNDNDKYLELEKKAVANTMFFKNMKVVKLDNCKDEFHENEFIINDEITYILSLIRIEKIVLLEKIDANIFGKYIDKKGMDGNYIIVNKFADKVLREYLDNNNI